VNTDINYEVVLRNCNDKLNQWDETWRTEMERGSSSLLPPAASLILALHTAGGESFHTSFLALFRLYVRLFLNSFGIHASMLPVGILPSLSPLPQFDPVSDREVAKVPVWGCYRSVVQAPWIH